VQRGPPVGDLFAHENFQSFRVLPLNQNVDYSCGFPDLRHNGEMGYGDVRPAPETAAGFLFGRALFPVAVSAGGKGRERWQPYYRNGCIDIWRGWKLGPL